jgi:hypothetical protein
VPRLQRHSLPFPFEATRKAALYLNDTK